MIEFRLTKYNSEEECGCKITPSDLNSIVKSNPSINNKRMEDTHSTNNAAVYDLQDGTAIISTTNFCKPIVDDAFSFGKIAAANALNKVYAMGATPLLANAIMAWPFDKLPPEEAAKVLEGGQHVCKEAGISLAEGHSIDNTYPFFGLSVSARAKINQLKRNNTATKGCLLYLTKPLGVGVLLSAQKQGILQTEHALLATEVMSQLNSIGAELSQMDDVVAITNVSECSLMGHLTQMCLDSGLSAEIEFDQLPQLQVLDEYIKQGCIPEKAVQNWQKYGSKIHLKSQTYWPLICDPQTNGGLLLTVPHNQAHTVEALLESKGMAAEPIGEFTKAKEHLITVY